MADEVRIQWSVRAKDDLDRIYNFILERWTLREAEAMLDIVQAFERMVVLHPLAFKDSPSFPNCRLAILHRNLTVVYQLDGHTVYILALFDNREDDPFRG
jgi:plasmid stabilization system protein ParE